MDFNIGNRVGDYEVIRTLGSGGMGQVYQVRNVITNRLEAMKVLLPDSAKEGEAAKRFEREIQVLAGLHHPNIATLYTAQRLDNQLVMFMEFVQGAPLSEKIRLARISLDEALHYLCQTLVALSYAHSHSVVHRDIKPANLMITPDGAVKVMDFGIAK